jgi:hypothetical protein
MSNASLPQGLEPRSSGAAAFWSGAADVLNTEWKYILVGVMILVLANHGHGAAPT